MGTIVTAVLLLMAIGLALGKMRSNKKTGKSLSCGGDCSHCASGCSMKNQ